VFVSDRSDPVDLIREGLARLSAEDRSTWSRAARSARLLELREVQERADAEVLRTIGGWDAAAAWADEADLGPVAWLASKGSMTRQEARNVLRTSRFVRDHQRTAEALASGEISEAHVEALAAVAHRRGELYEAHEQTLVDAAKRVAVQDFGVVTRRWRALADDALARDDAAFAFERRGLHFLPTLGGTVVHGFLDAEASAVIARALDATQPPDPTGADARSLAQRRADAWLMQAQGEGTTAAHADIVVSHEVLAERALLELDTARCDIEGFGPIARVTAERLLCDCELGRVVMRGKSEILDYGRQTRTVPRRLRRLVVIRDEYCLYPGCRAPAAWCDVHHLVHWLHGGETNVDNLALLCRRHHVACHEGAWKLARGPDGLTLAA
jgi:hypothetical protein